MPLKRECLNGVLKDKQESFRQRKRRHPMKKQSLGKDMEKGSNLAIGEMIYSPL
jgi:hypothetical protein